MERIMPVANLTLFPTNSVATNFDTDLNVLEQKKAAITEAIEDMEGSSLDTKQRELLELELKLKLIELQIERLEEKSKVATFTQQTQSEENEDPSLKVEISEEALQLCLDSLGNESDFTQKESEQQESKRERDKHQK